MVHGNIQVYSYIASQLPSWLVVKNKLTDDGKHSSIESYQNLREVEPKIIQFHVHNCNFVQHKGLTGGKCGEFGELSVICQAKTIQIIVLTMNILLADLLIHQIFIHQMLENSKITKPFPRQIFLLYSSQLANQQVRV